MSTSHSHVTFEAPKSEEVAALFPNYDVYGLIACGGMGAVYHARQRSLDRDVAIKILPREFSQNKEFSISFEAEAKAMAKLNHPNLIGVYDFGDVSGLLYIVMEYVSGSSLYAMSHGRAFHQEDALKMVIDICRGLAHAHQYGVLHRDIKPSNILLDANANPKIGDFGLASALGKQVEEGEQIFGTPGYTAPEVIDPPHVFDHRADIFSVGVLLHELLTGITPNGVEPLAALPHTIHPRLRGAIQRATQPNPAARHDSAEELAAELEKIAAIPHNPLLAAAVNPRAVRPMSRPMSRPVARTMTRHPVMKKNSSSGAGYLILLVIVVLAAIVVLVIKSGNTAPAAKDGGTSTPTVKNVQPTVQKPVRRKTAAQEGLTPIDDVDAYFARVEGIMKKRLRSDLDTYRQGLKANTRDFETQAKQAIGNLSAGAAVKARADLESIMAAWSAQNDNMPGSLPASLDKISTVQQAFAQAHAVEAKLRSRFYSRLMSEEAAYIRGLEKQIIQYRETKDHVAMNLIQKEITRLGSERGYFEFLISE
jgi:serine/threonine protein kinase